MKVKPTPLADIAPYKKNPRDNKASIDKVAASIEEFGWRQPIVVDKKMVIVAGHTRYWAAVKLGLHKVPVHVAEDLTAKQIRAYRLADNRSGEDSKWIEELLRDELRAVKDEGTDLAITGFSERQIKKALDDADKEKDKRGAPQLGADLEFRVVIDCDGEKHQKELITSFEKKGLTCRALIS